MARYGMAIDLARCCGCGACVVACKVIHHTPPGIFWARVLMKEYGTYPGVRRTIMPVLCNHCQEAACVRVCPSGATSRRADGIVTVDYAKCIGCRYCMMACPYGSRHFYTTVSSYFPTGQLTPDEKLGYSQLQTGVVMKCNFCQERIDQGLKKGLQPGADPDATPACVNTCITKARYFGDLDDPKSEVSQLITRKQGYQLHPEFGTEPSVYYLK